MNAVKLTRKDAAEEAIEGEEGTRGRGVTYLLIYSKKEGSGGSRIEGFVRSSCKKEEDEGVEKGGRAHTRKLI